MAATYREAVYRRFARGAHGSREEDDMGYHLEGRLLEVCTCNVICPCWVGEDPDGGSCDGMLAWHIDRGQADGVDCAGLTLAGCARIPGNVLAGNWKAAFYVDGKATDAQTDALFKAFSGGLDRPLAEMAKLIGEVVSVERADIEFDVQHGRGTLKVGDVGHAELEPLRGGTGELTTLRDSVFSTIAGAPAYIAKSLRYRNKQDKLGIDLDIAGRNAIQGTFVFDA